MTGGAGAASAPSFVGLDPVRKFLRTPFNETHENLFSTAKMNDVQQWR